MQDQFNRISRLPPYVFNIIGELKQAARARGEDVIDFGMGNPDQPTPKHIVDKLTETAQRGDTHRYSQSRGIPRLRKAICDWYKRRYDVDLNPETEAIVTLGSKEGLAIWRWQPPAPVMRFWCQTPPTRFTPMVSSSPVPIFAMCRWGMVTAFLTSWNRPFATAGPSRRCWC